MEDKPKLIKVKEVTEILGVSQTQVKTYRKKGILHSVQYMPGGDHRYYLDEVMKLLQGKK